MVFSPDSRSLAWSGDDDSLVRLLEVASGRHRHQLSGHLGPVSSLAFSADGSRLVSAGIDTTALVWDLGAGQPAVSAQDCETAWADLAREDALRAYQAIRRLAGAPAFLSGRLRPFTVADSKQVTQLIADLDASDFTTRQKAATELERLGEAAAVACRQALDERPSAEARRQLEAIVDKISQAAWVITPDRLRAVRSLEALELSGTPEACRVLEKVASAGPGSHLSEEANASLQRVRSRPRVPEAPMGHGSQ